MGKNATEHFIFTENKLTITKSIFNKTLLSQDINLNDIREIQYSAWSSISFPYLPYKTQGNIHIQTPSKSYSFAINLNQEESEAFIEQLLHTISKFDKSGHFIFVKHLHLK